MPVSASSAVTQQFGDNSQHIGDETPAWLTLVILALIGGVALYLWRNK